MTEPKSRKEYEEKLRKNTAYANDKLSCTMPCPFCAEPGFATYRITEVDETLSKGAVCKYCFRGMRTLKIDHKHGVTEMRFIQTEGPEPGPYAPELDRDS